MKRKLPALACASIMLFAMSACSTDADTKEKNPEGNEYSQVDPSKDAPKDEEGNIIDPEKVLPESGDEPEAIEGTTMEEDGTEDKEAFPADPETGETPTSIDYVVPAWDNTSLSEALAVIDGIEGFDGSIFIIDNKTDVILESNKIKDNFIVCKSLPAAEDEIQLDDNTRFMLWVAETC